MRSPLWQIIVDGGAEIYELPCGMIIIILHIYLCMYVWPHCVGRFSTTERASRRRTQSSNSWQLFYCFRALRKTWRLVCNFCFSSTSCTYVSFFYLDFCFVSFQRKCLPLSLSLSLSLSVSVFLSSLFIFLVFILLQYYYSLL